jgi:large subunit ribosomal protein L23
MEPRQIVKQFLVTEKSTVIRDTQEKYAFAVDRRANKHQIKEAIEKLFKVHVASVHTVIVPGKIKRLGRFAGKTAAWKKAIIKLAGGEKITELENI